MKRFLGIQSSLWLGLLALCSGGAYWLGRQHEPAHLAQPQQPQRTILYWYDPMVPDQHFNVPGKSPFMDMELQPKYAEASDSRHRVTIDPAMIQNLGIRVAPVKRDFLDLSFKASATVQRNDRAVVIIQARTNGFVERVYNRAPGDIVTSGTPLVDIRVPDWAGAQQEFLSLSKTHETELINAGRERLTQLGMPAALIAQVERSQVVHPLFTVRTPLAGELESLEVRSGMTLTAGTTLAQINTLDPVWLEAAIPEAQTDDIHQGDTIETEFSAYPGKRFQGHVSTVLPDMDSQTHTLRVRVDLDNHASLFRPGMYATLHTHHRTTQALLWVPTEALIPGGTHTLVMVAKDGGSFEPVAVTVGMESHGRTAVLSGLSEGQKVVVSGQFLIDSEANLQGVMTRGAP